VIKKTNCRECIKKTLYYFKSFQRTGILTVSADKEHVRYLAKHIEVVQEFKN